MRGRMAGGAQRLLLVNTVVLVALAGGCSDSVAPDRPPSRSVDAAAVAAALQARPGRGIDAEFTRLATKMAGFGGMYYDGSGKLNVYLKAQPGAAVARSGDVLGRLRSLGGRGVERRLRRASSVVLQEAEYDFLQLQRWKSRLGQIFTVRGVVFTDVDESQNRLRIGITPSASRGAVEQVLASAGVPRAAVIISRVSPIKKMHTTLRERFRPVPAGVQLVFPAPSVDPGALFVCTLGFNARRPPDPRKFFVTASHCSDKQGANQLTPYFQPGPVAGQPNTNRIAVEYQDPRYGNPGGLCEDFPGYRCRLSDALLSKYRPEVQPQLGKIARTTFSLQRLGSLKIDVNKPRWTIVDELPFPFEGEIAHKVGRSSGWTVGPVVLTCLDVNIDGTDIVLLCQDIVLAGVRAGDSGSPVFERLDDFVGGVSSNVLLTGVLWGGGTINGAPVFLFSAMENIESELGPLETQASSMVASAP